jgi:hypothetical protein
MTEIPENLNKVKSLLPYDISRGGQVIENLDLTPFKNNRQNKLYHHVQSKCEELKNQYNDMLELWKWNEYVDSFEIGFEPVVGKVYYLYEGVNRFVSILSPEEFKRECVGFIRLNSEGYWEKL